MEKPVLKRLLSLAALALAACATPPAPEPEQAPEPVVFEPVPAPPPVVLVAEKPKPAPKPVAATPRPVIATPKPFTAKPIEVDPPDIVGIDRALEPKDLWSRIRKGFAIEDLRSPLVNQKTKQYVARPEYLQRIRAHLSDASHHLIVYRSNETVEQTTPFRCRGFSGVSSPTMFETPLVIAQNHDAQAQFFVKSEPYKSQHQFRQFD